MGAATTIAEAVHRAQELRLDVVLVDITLGFESGLDLAPRLGNSGATVILISTHAEADFADLIAETPAAGFVPKSELSVDGIRQLVDAAPERARRQRRIRPPTVSVPATR